jgi:GNAT superfamily N-acetyltransferase
VTEVNADRTADPVTVRAATSADSTRFAQILSQAGWPTDSSEMAVRLESILSHSDYASYVAERGASVVGIVGACITLFYQRNGSCARLIVLAVDPAHRREGIGPALLTAVEHWASSRGAVEILYNPGHQRHDLQNFYSRMGFTNTGLRFAKSLVPSSRS